jgi:hypothetical protein
MVPRMALCDTVVVMPSMKILRRGTRVLRRCPLYCRLLRCTRASRVHQLLNERKLVAVDVYDETRGTRIGHLVTLSSIARRRRRRIRHKCNLLADAFRSEYGNQLYSVPTFTCSQVVEPTVIGACSGREGFPYPTARRAHRIRSGLNWPRSTAHRCHGDTRQNNCPASAGRPQAGHCSRPQFSIGSGHLAKTRWG